MDQKQINKGKDDNLFAKIWERYWKMRTERTKLESERVVSEQQVDAPSYLDNDGKILFNSQTEQSLCEQYVGRVNNQIYWDMKPEEEAEASELYASQKVLNYFMEKENFYRELAMRDYSKSIYGMGIWYTGLTLDVEKKFKPKEGAEADQEDYSGGIEDDNLFEEYTQYNRQFCPKNVRPRDFYRDNRYFWQDKRELVEDCIRVEYISKDKLEERRGKDDRYDISGLEEKTWEDRSNWGSAHLYVIKLLHYYNKNTKEYIILGNDCKVVRGTKMKYKHGRLPFEVAQHYPDNRCICGRGIPRKTRASKAYKNNMMQAALDKTWSSAFGNIILGKNNVLNNKYQVGGGINIREVNSAANENFQQFQTDSNISGLQIAVELMNDEIRTDTGEDPKAAFDINPQEKLGQTEIKEENKAIRLKAIQIARDICLDNALTQAYCNIQQFAPYVLRKEQDIDGIKKVIRPVISLPGIKVTKKGGKQILEDVQDYGQYGRYELNPKYRMIDGSVKIVTNSSYNKAGSVLEKNKFTELVTNYVQLAQVYGPEILQKMPADTMISLMNQAYGYDPDMKYMAKTKKDEIREKNEEKIEALKAMMGGGLMTQNPLQTNGQPNENPQQQAVGGIEQQPAELQSDYVKTTTGIG